MVNLIIITLSYLLTLSAGFIILRVFVRRDYLQLGKLRLITAFLQGLLFFIHGSLPLLYLPQDWPKINVPDWISVIGLSLIVIGLSTLLISMTKLGIQTSLGRGEKELVKTGLYTITRNPQSIAYGLFVIGFSILWPSWFSLGWAILYFILIHTMILTEEEHLTRLYGEKYQAYLQQTPRYMNLTR